MSFLEINNLNVEFDTADGIVRAVNNVSFTLDQGKILAIVGESGSGKSQTVFAMMGLLDQNGRATGSVKFEGEEILNLSITELNSVRAEKIAMIFQDPMTSLNPYMRISEQMAEVLIHHKGLSKTEAIQQSINLLDAVKIPEAKSRIRMYPHEFSGGMRQRRFCNLNRSATNSASGNPAALGSMACLMSCMSKKEIALCQWQFRCRFAREQLAVGLDRVRLGIDLDFRQLVVVHHVGLSNVARVTHRLDALGQAHSIGQARLVRRPADEGHASLELGTAVRGELRPVKRWLRRGNGRIWVPHVGAGNHAALED